MVVPSARQLAFQQAEFGMFCHFGPNTFLDQEWGDGSEDPAVVHPTACDPRQWARAAREAGMRYLVVTAKHHDGFCNWPTDTTDHSLKSSPWQAGRGDLVELAAEAARAEGLHFGLYLSPWDRHDPRYPDAAAYDELYLAQWRELLTRYGKVFCCWLDGAGSQGRVYDWERIIGQIRGLQPEACVFSMGEPDYRWVGNEDGLAPDPCWNVIEKPEDYLGHDQFMTAAYRESFPHWLPAECDARIRANWFWNTYDLPTLKSTERLVDMYYKSVGSGCNLMLNVGPDTRGLLPETDVERLLAMGAEIRRRFASPLAEAGEAGPRTGARAVVAGAVQAAPDGSVAAETAAGTLEVLFAKPTAINHVRIQEDVAHGERVREYIVQVLSHGRWEGVHVGTAIGYQRINRFPTIEVEGVRVHVSRASGEPRLRSLQVFAVR
ncbi:MAG TPA: alpha-L-fucosidase [Armatimonadota bacterium]|jgi:alpha-L-fucosidase